MLMPVLVPLTWLGVLGAGSMAVYLFAMRCVSWDLVPAAALPRVLWWRRHAPRVLVVSAVVALVGGAFVMWAP